MMTTCVHCGCDVETPSKRRSVEQLRRYFAMIRAAFVHWPESHEWQFANAEELRSFLQIKAGYRVVGANIPLVGLNKDKALMLVAASIRGAGSFAIPTFYDNSIVVFKPKSIAFHKMGPAEFCALNDSVSVVIEQETGTPAAEFLRQTEAAA